MQRISLKRAGIEAVGKLSSLRVWRFDDAGKNDGDAGGGFRMEAAINEFVGEVNKPVALAGTGSA